MWEPLSSPMQLLVALACCVTTAAGAVSQANGSCLIQMSDRVSRSLQSADWGNMHSRCPGGACVVPAGELWAMDSSVDVDTLTIRGTLRWDITKDDLELRAGYVVVEDGGHLQVGTTDAPMEQRATIYLKKGHTHEMLGTRVLGGLGTGKIDVHGRMLRRTWTLLSRTAFAGATQLYVKDDPHWMGWRPGDRIGVATTSRGESTVHTIAEIGPPAAEPVGCQGMPDVKKTCAADQCRVLATNMHDTTCRTYCSRSGLTCAAAYEDVDNDCNIKAVLGCDETWPGTSDLICECMPPMGIVTSSADKRAVRVLHLKEPLRDEHWGGFKNVVGRQLEMAAEVVNLERSVLITGDHDDFYTSNAGLHTVMAGTGYVDMRYARVEYCGQRDIMGRYCLHFHLMGQCPLCVFEGNAVVDSAQVGITIHGTHNALVSNNVIWDGRAVGIYTEDGNEMDNLIKQNVVICSWWQVCSVNWLQNVGLHAGIFLIGMTNDLIENRVVGHENCIWTPGGARGDGHGAAFTKVCPTFTPFGEIRGNVNHDCQRFGLYLDNQSPRNIKRDENGFVIDKESCQKFTPDGRDNGMQPPNIIQDEFDWHNMFVGQYNMGDVQYVNYTGVNNYHSMYWKSSKNFADGRLWHIKDSLILNDPNDLIGELQFMGPGGPHVFGIQNTVFAGGPTGCAALCAGQHCGLGGSGGPCNSQYLLESVDLSGVDGQRIEFGAHCSDPGKVLPVFLAKDASLGGHRSMVSRFLDGFGAVAGCSPQGTDWAGAFGCSVDVRRLNIWGTDTGDLRLNGPGYAVAANQEAPVTGMNAGRMVYEAMNGKAYGTPVVVGAAYALTGVWRSDMVLDFSDGPLADYFGRTEAVVLEVDGVHCLLRASDDRRFLSPKGPVPRVLETHARIQSGLLLCGGPPGAPPKPPSQCSRLADVVEQCSADGCRVLARRMRGRTCAGYCEAAGLFCAGAWGAVGDGCAVRDRAVGCREVWPRHKLICECGPEPAPPASTTLLTTTTVLPPDEPIGAPPSGTKNPQMPVCNSLPDVKQRCSDSGCKVLAGSMTGLACKEYCARNSLECVGAWEEVADDCSIKATLDCAEVWPGTSDLICECAPTATTTPGPGYPGGQLPLPTAECNLPDVKEFCSSSGCKVLAGNMMGKTCDEYCSRSELFCVGAWEEVDDTCSEEVVLRCDQSMPGASDLLCECSTQRRSGPPTPLATPLPQTPPAPGGTAWLNHKGFNCYGGTGAVGVPGKSPMAGRVRAHQCKKECEKDERCEGVVVKRGVQGPQQCWLVQDLTPVACIKNTEYDLWQQIPASDSVGRQTISQDNLPATPSSPVGSPTVPTPLPSRVTSPATTTAVTTTTTTTTTTTITTITTTTTTGPPGAAWLHHRGYNCYDGVGALGVPGKSPMAGMFLLEGCKSECQAVVECEGIIMVRDMLSDGVPYLCWLVRDLAPAACYKNTVYDLWLRPGGVEQQSTSASATDLQNIYEHTSGVGEWGGWCTCPDGQRYNVGDLQDACVNGPGSLACFGGTPGECMKEVDFARAGMRVTCTPGK